MTREEVFIRILLCVIVMAIYTYFVKWKSYQEGFFDGVKYYSDIVDEVLHDTNQFNKKYGGKQIDYYRQAQTRKRGIDKE